MLDVDTDAEHTTTGVQAVTQVQTAMDKPKRRVGRPAYLKDYI